MVARSRNEFCDPGVSRHDVAVWTRLAALTGTVCQLQLLAGLRKARQARNLISSAWAIHRSQQILMNRRSRVDAHRTVEVRPPANRNFRFCRAPAAFPVRRRGSLRVETHRQHQSRPP